MRKQFKGFFSGMSKHKGVFAGLNFFAKSLQKEVFYVELVINDQEFCSHV
jgi:hypothetical protein